MTYVVREKTIEAIKSMLPAADSSDNDSMSAVIGNKSDKSFSDNSATPSVLGHMTAMYYHTHGASKVYPAGADPVTLTDKNDGGTTPWGHGTIVEIIPASTITTAFDIHWVNVSTISAVDDYEIKLYKGAPASEVLIGTISFSRSTNFSSEGHLPIQMAQQAANERISASLASGDADGSTCNIKLYYHQYPDIS